ncbi:hypothetical protein K438DRAFT_1979534 [Mycena galopus ATCC 62051]|nr:hypothetical protein K438DRAFT_1979534 [Mycena galopus ATCC 62051]
MPSVVHTIDVNSPLIRYAGPWNLGGADGDSEADKNNLSTFVYCAGTQCSATLSFTGTDVHVIGAYRNNSGPYQVNLDGQIFGPFGTEPVVVEQFQIDLFNRTNMLAGAHTLTISNLPATVLTSPNIDLDYFTWTSEVNSSSDVRIQDDDPAFMYEPSAAWNAFKNFPGLPGFDQGPGQQVATMENDAKVTFSFTGDRVALYGAIGVQGGPYSVQIDDGNVSTFTAQQMISDPNTPLANYLSGQLLLYADSLALGNHTVTVASNVVSPTQDVAIDYAIVGETNSVPSGAAPSLSSTPSGSAGPRTALSSAKLGGIVAGATLLGLCFLGGLVYILTLRQRRRRKLSYEINTSAGFDSSSVAQVSYPTQVASSSEPPASVIPFVSVIPPRLSEKRCQGRELDPPEYNALPGVTHNPLV